MRWVITDINGIEDVVEADEWQESGAFVEFIDDEGATVFAITVDIVRSFRREETTK